MKRAYKAILRGDRVEWLNGAPDEQGPLLVEITVTKELDPDEEADIVETGFPTTFKSSRTWGRSTEIEDPVAWQREIRKDRPLPGRE